MVEQYLLKIGMHCGTVKNFNSSILDDVRRNDYQHWYFLTPLKSKDNGHGLKEVTINMAYPFLAERNDISEEEVIKRLKALEFQTELLKVLRKNVIVSSHTISVIPFWGNEKGAERNERQDFGQTRVHLINASLIVLYRDNYFN
jgi:hypothetical protein